jgi:superfamily I DNA/RNA helicase
LLSAAVRVERGLAAASGVGVEDPVLAVAATNGADGGRVGRAVLGWAAGFPDLASLRRAVEQVRARRSVPLDGRSLVLATVHGTKGLEFDHVAVVGLDDGTFPSRRSIEEAEDPGRALEEERRLCYVAWTRARRTLTLVYDPWAPSVFLREAFDPAELAASGRGRDT